MASRSDPISPAIEQVLARLHGLVRHAARSRKLDEADIDEVLQDVRIRLWRSLASGEKIASAPASYVYRTAVSATMDFIRRRRARREESLDQLHDPPSATAEAAMVAELEDEEAMTRLERALGSLAESRRVVVRMHLGGYHLSEIARMLDWSEAKTRNLLYRGLADLRAQFVDVGVRSGKSA